MVYSHIHVPAKKETYVIGSFPRESYFFGENNDRHKILICGQILMKFYYDVDETLYLPRA